MFEPGQLAALIFSLGFLAFVVELVRRQALTVRYSLVWLAVAGAMVVAGGFAYPLVLRVAPLLGFAYPPSALFFLAFCGFGLVALHHSAVLTRLHAENSRLCQRLAILETEVARRGGAGAEPPRG